MRLSSNGSTPGGPIPKNCDVVVIGGGPAGSSAAALLARAGLDVVLFDKAKHPRPAVGESIIPHFWKLADLLGVTAKVEQEGFIAKAGGIVVWNGKVQQLRFSNFGFTRPGLHVERDRFDHLLLQYAAECGAHIFEEVAAQWVDFSAAETPSVLHKDRRGTRPVPGSIRCKYVVDASGPTAFLARQLNVRKLSSTERKYLGLWGYYANSRYVGDDRRSHGPEDLAEVRPVTLVCSYEDGWAWHIILRESTSVGLVINTDRIRGLGKAAQAQYLQQTCAEIPYLRELLIPATFIEGSMFFRPDYSYYSEKVWGESFFCIGDAAAFVDPIFSQGVVAALYNAFICAWAITASHKNPRRKANYGKIFERQLLQYYGFSRLLAHGDFGGDGINPDSVQAMMNSLPRHDLELTLAASSTTNRSDNLRRMAREAGLDLGPDFELAKVEYMSDLDLSEEPPKNSSSTLSTGVSIP